jgi:hypothetical protein
MQKQTLSAQREQALAPTHERDVRDVSLKRL